MSAHNLVAALLLASVALAPAACSREEDGKRPQGDDASPADPAAWARLAGFTSIEATGPDTVIVTRGPFSVRAEGDAKVLDRLKIVVDGDTLEIGRKRRTGMNWSDDRGATIRVSLPAIRAVEATGSGSVEATGSSSVEATGSAEGLVAFALALAFAACLALALVDSTPSAPFLSSFLCDASSNSISA